MSIILDALKKARRDRQHDTNLQDDAVFRQVQYEDARRLKRAAGVSPHRVATGFVAILILGICIVAISLVFYLRSGRYPRQSRQPSTLQRDSASAESIGAKKSLESSIRGAVKATKTPEPEPTRILLVIAPVSTPTPLPTHTVPPTPTYTPAPTPSISPAPTPSTVVKKTPPGRKVSQRPLYERPEDFGIKLGGVMWDEKNPVALINDKITEVGQGVDDMLVKKITKTYVEIEKDGVSYKFKY